MSVKISRSNSKLGVIPSVNLPPILTCRENCPCFSSCYARKGNYRFKNVQESMRLNLEEYKQNPDGYFAQIKCGISDGIVSYNYFRWHAAGDIVDGDYFERMVRLAIELPHTQFLAFTKKFEIINSYLESGNSIPLNLTVVFSAWGDEFKVENPYNMPIAYVRTTNSTGIPSDAEECNGDCTNCLKCWNIKSGQSVVFNKH